MIVKAGQTGVITYWLLEDYVTGEPVTGLAITDISICYIRDQEDHSALTALTAHAAVTDNFDDYEGIEIDATACPGLYRIDFPDTAFALTAHKVQLYVKDAGTPRTFRHAAMEAVLETWSVQIEGIAATGVALNQTAESATITTGTPTNTYAKTLAHDEDYHRVAEVGNIIDFYYEFDIGLGAVPVEVVIHGRLDEGSPPSGGDTVHFHVWDWTIPAWEHIHNPAGDFAGIFNSSSDDDVTRTAILFARHVGTGGNEGLVRIRLEGSTLEGSTEMYVDFLYLEFAKTGVDVIQISGDAVAADNLEAMLDGTGGVNLSLGRLIINNAAASAAVDIDSAGVGIDVASAGNSPGVSITGKGTGAGVEVTGGDSSGIGVEIVGGAPNGIGIQLTGDGSGAALDLDSGVGAGVDITSVTGIGVAIDGAKGMLIQGDPNQGLQIVGVTADILADITGGLSGSVGGDVGGNVDGTIGGFTTAAKAELQIEANDALIANNLDHLMKTAVANNADMTTEVVDGTVLSNIMTKGSNTSDFVVATDALEALADVLATAATPAIIADAVWDEALSGHTTNDTAGEVLTKAGLGSGGTDWTIEVVSSGSGNPEQGATVELFLDADRNDLYTGGETDGNGQITFSLVSGTTYYYRIMENDFTTKYGSFTVT